MSLLSRDYFTQWVKCGAVTLSIRDCLDSEANKVKSMDKKWVSKQLMRTMVAYIRQKALKPKGLQKAVKDKIHCNKNSAQQEKTQNIKWLGRESHLPPNLKTWVYLSLRFLWLWKDPTPASCPLTSTHVCTHTHAKINIKGFHLKCYRWI